MINDFYLVLTNLDGDAQTIKLNLQKYVIGRSSNCDICIVVPFLSRFHCTLILNQTDRDYFYTLWDGIPLLKSASTGGTYLNGIRIKKPTILKTGDTITFARNKDIPSIQFVVEQPANHHEETVGFHYEEES